MVPVAVEHGECEEKVESVVLAVKLCDVVQVPVADFVADRDCIAVFVTVAVEVPVPLLLPLRKADADAVPVPVAVVVVDLRDDWLLEWVPEELPVEEIVDMLVRVWFPVPELRGDSLLEVVPVELAVAVGLLVHWIFETVDEPVDEPPVDEPVDEPPVDEPVDVPVDEPERRAEDEPLDETVDVPLAVDVLDWRTDLVLEVVPVALPEEVSVDCRRRR